MNKLTNRDGNCIDIICNIIKVFFLSIFLNGFLDGNGPQTRNENLRGEHSWKACMNSAGDSHSLKVNVDGGGDRVN